MIASRDRINDSSFSRSQQKRKSTTNFTNKSEDKKTDVHCQIIPGAADGAIASTCHGRLRRGQGGELRVRIPGRHDVVDDIHGACSGRLRRQAPPRLRSTNIVVVDNRCRSAAAAWRFIDERIASRHRRIGIRVSRSDSARQCWILRRRHRPHRALSVRRRRVVVVGVVVAHWPQYESVRLPAGSLLRRRQGHGRRRQPARLM